jgi:hypothetical protein
MTEKPKKTPKQKKPSKGANTLESVNANIVTIFQTTVHMLEETLRAGKLNPAEGLLGMVMIADLMHGGAYTVPNSDRPALVGKYSPYYGGDQIIFAVTGGTDFYPVAGFNIFDIFSSLFTTAEASLETNVGQAIAAEVYANANVPHLFPKLLSDEAYAKILVMSLYMAHSEIVLKNATAARTFVEGESKLVTAEAGALKEVAGSGAAAIKQLAPVLGLVAGS